MKSLKSLNFQGSWKGISNLQKWSMTLLDLQYRKDTMYVTGQAKEILIWLNKRNLYFCVTSMYQKQTVKTIWLTRRSLNLNFISKAILKKDTPMFAPKFILIIGVLYISMEVIIVERTKSCSKFILL